MKQEVSAESKDKTNHFEHDSNHTMIKHESKGNKRYFVNVEITNMNIA